MKWETGVFFVVLFIFSVFLIKTIDDTGVTYDEPAYFDKTLTITNSSLSFFERFDTFTPPQHGTFMFIIAGIIYNLTKEALDLTTSLRLGTSLLYLLFICIFFFFIRKEFDAFTALISSLILMGMPQVFFHAHLLAMDFPVMVLYFISMVFTYYAITTKKISMTLLASVSLGAILATKVTGYLIFFSLFVYVIFLLWKRKKGDAFLKVGKWKVPKVVMILLCSGLFYIVISPPLYENPFIFFEQIDFHGPRVDDHPIFLFNATHESHEIVTFLYVIFSLLITINALHVWFAIFCLAVLLRSKNNEELINYLLIIFFTTFLFFSSPWGYKADGPRHFLMLYPFMALFAGIGVRILVDSISSLQRFKKNRQRIHNIAKIGFFAIVVLSSAFTIVATHPFQSSYFNGLVGGSQGVSTINLYTVTYWQDEFKYTLGWFNQLPENTTIGGHPYHWPLVWYQRIGLLRSDLKISDEEMEYIVVPLRQSEYTVDPWDLERGAWGKFSELEHLFEVKNKQGTAVARVFNITQSEEDYYEAIRELKDSWDRYYEEAKKESVVYSAYFKSKERERKSLKTEAK